MTMNVPQVVAIATYAALIIVLPLAVALVLRIIGILERDVFDR